MTEGVDYAFTVVNEQQLYAAGKRFAGRYGGPGSTGKHLTASERDRIFAAGMDIFALAEGTGHDGGYSTGLSYGRSARAEFTALGMPSTLPIYTGPDDFDAQPGDWPALSAYLDGFAVGVGGVHLTGLYGSWDALTWAKRDGKATWFFQAYATAWSHGRNAADWPGAHIRQYHNGVAMAGGEVDLCRSKVANFGQWLHTPPPPPPDGGDMALTPDDIAAIWNADIDLGSGVLPAREALRLAWIHATNLDNTSVPAIATDVDALTTKVDQILADLAGSSPTDALTAKEQAVALRAAADKLDPQG